MDDPYNPPSRGKPAPFGMKTVLRMRRDGKLVSALIPIPERGRVNQKKVRELKDDHIGQIVAHRNGRVDYWVGRITVSWRPGRGYSCNDCRKRDCAHTRRLDTWRGEHFL